MMKKSNTELLKAIDETWIVWNAVCFHCDKPSGPIYQHRKEFSFPREFCPFCNEHVSWSWLATIPGVISVVGESEEL